MARFAAGFKDGVQAHPAVRDALSEPDDTPPGAASNPAPRVRFGFDADSPEAAERLATGEIRDAGLAAGMRALSATSVSSAG